MAFSDPLLEVVSDPYRDTTWNSRACFLASPRLRLAFSILPTEVHSRQSCRNSHLQYPRRANYHQNNTRSYKYFNLNRAGIRRPFWNRITLSIPCFRATNQARALLEFLQEPLAIHRDLKVLDIELDKEMWHAPSDVEWYTLQKLRQYLVTSIKLQWLILRFFIFEKDLKLLHGCWRLLISLRWSDKSLRMSSR
jgi:hypothetical protein